MILLTFFFHHDMFARPTLYLYFWLWQCGKLAFMLASAFVGGLIVIGYRVKVNYTRKIQVQLSSCSLIHSYMRTHCYAVRLVRN
jgi:hypothetical protein